MLRWHHGFLHQVTDALEARPVAVNLLHVERIGRSGCAALHSRATGRTGGLGRLRGL